MYKELLGSKLQENENNIWNILRWKERQWKKKSPDIKGKLYTQDLQPGVSNTFSLYSALNVQINEEGKGGHK